MLFLIALLLAIFVLPSPWGLVAVVIAALLDIAETGALHVVVEAAEVVGRASRRSSAGAGSPSADLWPEGQVKVDGEIWRARCPGGCDAGTSVVVRSVEGLTLVVDPT